VEEEWFGCLFVLGLVFGGVVCSGLVWSGLIWLIVRACFRVGGTPFVYIAELKLPKLWHIVLKSCITHEF
jgi:hypothetical protein